MNSKSRLLAVISGGAVAATLTVGIVGGLPGAERASASPAKIAACTGKDLAASYLGGGGAAGTRYGDLKLTNRTAHRCELNVAPHSVFFSADGHNDRVGRTGSYGFESISPATPSSKRSHFALSAHGGHVYIRIGIGEAANYGKQCRPVVVSSLVTTLRGSSAKIDAPLNGRSFETCTNSKDKILSFGQYRAHRSTTAG